MIKRIFAITALFALCMGPAFAQEAYEEVVIVAEPTAVAAVAENNGNDDNGEYEEAGHRGLTFDFGNATFSIGGGAGMVVVPLQAIARDTAEDQGNVWIGAGTGASAGILTRLSLSGNYDNRIGFNTDILFLYSTSGDNLWEGHNPNAMEVRLGDNGHIWWRPTDWFRLSAGRIFNPSQAGRVGAHGMAIWTVGMFNGDNIFSSHFGNIGVLAGFSPPQIEGLAVYAFIPSFGMMFDRPNYDFPWLPGALLTPGGVDLSNVDDGLNRYRASRVYQRTWLTVGYQTSAFHARMQLAGDNPSGMINWTTGEGADSVPTLSYRYRISMSAPRFEAAFAFTGLDSLVVDAGVRTWIPVSDWITNIWNDDPDNPGYIRLSGTGTYWGGIGFGLGISYQVIEDRLRVNARFDGSLARRWSGRHLGEDTVITNPMLLSFHLWPTYTFGNGIQLTASAGLNYVGRNSVDIGGMNPNENCIHWERSDRLRFGGGISAALPIGGRQQGLLSFGLAYSHGTADIRGGEARVITIPISFNYSF